MFVGNFKEYTPQEMHRLQPIERIYSNGKVHQTGCCCCCCVVAKVIRPRTMYYCQAQDCKLLKEILRAVATG